MANHELVQVLDFILNRSDEASIEVLAEAVVRRRRDLAMFGGVLKLPDPQRMAAEFSSQMNASIGAGVGDLKKSIRQMAASIIKQQAPELSEGQIAELAGAWIPDTGNTGTNTTAILPRDILSSMIEQFIAFSQGTMSAAEDKGLRDEMGAWPERYWKAFPAVIRSVITDYLKGIISKKDFYSKAGIALEMVS